MFGLGKVINTGAVIAGSLVGMTLKKGIPENCRQILMHACGVATIFIGAAGVRQKIPGRKHAAFPSYSAALYGSNRPFLNNRIKGLFRNLHPQKA